ncbi:hypothetical protein MMC09_005529 [Bachmanniomyces sp. S44760]|nr:hypothetical protein [Bachmanniomyces sp. S44760]
MVDNIQMELRHLGFRSWGQYNSYYDLWVLVSMELYATSVIKASIAQEEQYRLQLPGSLLSWDISGIHHYEATQAEACHRLCPSTGIVSVGRDCYREVVYHASDGISDTDAVHRVGERYKVYITSFSHV